MKWYNDLYVGHNAMEDKDKIVDKIIRGKLQLNKYVITLPLNNRDTLDIYPAYVLVQKWYRKSDMIVVGIADGKEEANEIVEMIIKDCLSELGKVDVRQYIESKMKEA